MIFEKNRVSYVYPTRILIAIFKIEKLHIFVPRVKTIHFHLLLTFDRVNKGFDKLKNTDLFLQCNVFL